MIGRVASALFASAILGCVKHPAPAAPDPALLPGAVWTPPVPAGAVVDGRYVDATLGFSVPVPSGWQAEPATETDATRVVLVDGAGLVRIRVSAGGPRPDHPDCTWSFDDAASGAWPALGPVSLSTCMPTDPDGPRVLAWDAAASSPPVRVEADAPPGHLVEAEDSAEGVLAGFSGR